MIAERREVGAKLYDGKKGLPLCIKFMYLGLLEIPAYGLAMLILLKAGRRIPYACSLLMAGIFLLSITLVPRGRRPESIQ